jgi:hypothetical protein
MCKQSDRHDAFLCVRTSCVSERDCVHLFRVYAIEATQGISRPTTINTDASGVDYANQPCFPFSSCC